LLHCKVEVQDRGWENDVIVAVRTSWSGRANRCEWSVLRQMAVVSLVVGRIGCVALVSGICLHSALLQSRVGHVACGGGGTCAISASCSVRLLLVAFVSAVMYTREHLDHVSARILQNLKYLHAALSVQRYPVQPDWVIRNQQTPAEVEDNYPDERSQSLTNDGAIHEERARVRVLRRRQ
jgi:hypothetical protein